MHVLCWNLKEMRCLLTAQNLICSLVFYYSTVSHHNYTSRSMKWKGVYWFHFVRFSVRPSVPLSVSGQNHVCSVSSTILGGSISYLHIFYHHQIGSMNHYPLFRVRSSNNGMRCMSFCILIEGGHNSHGNFTSCILARFTPWPMELVLTSPCLEPHPDSKVHGTNMGPIWGQQDPDGPHVGPMNFAICVQSMKPGLVLMCPTYLTYCKTIVSTVTGSCILLQIYWYIPFLHLYFTIYQLCKQHNFSLYSSFCSIFCWSFQYFQPSKSHSQAKKIEYFLYELHWSNKR